MRLSKECVVLQREEVENSRKENYINTKLFILLITVDTTCTLVHIVGKGRNWAWWFTPVIPSLGRLKQEDHKLEASLDYIGRPCLKTKKKEEEEK
jgi:hypothetical protein